MSEVLVRDILAHQLNVRMVIRGKYIEKKHPVTGQDVIDGDGEILYNRADTIHRPWFVIAFESGNRVKKKDSD